jgi:hypothetical protein
MIFGQDYNKVCGSDDALKAFTTEYRAMPKSLLMSKKEKEEKKQDISIESKSMVKLSDDAKGFMSRGGSYKQKLGQPTSLAIVHIQAKVGELKMVLRQNILASSRPTGKGRSEESRHGRFGG